MGKLIGYGRVSKDTQSADLQHDALVKAGCDRIFIDVGVSGRLASRPELDKVMTDVLFEGDTLVVWKLDRIARNTKNLLELIDDLEKRGIGFRSLTDGIETTGPMGRALLTIMAAFATLEADTNRERTQAGLAAARARGRVGGRKPSLSKSQSQQVKAMYDAKMTVSGIAKTMGVSRQTIYRYLETSDKTASV